MTEPTDDELDAVIAEYRTRIYPQDMYPRFERAIMRAAIAKWGTPPAEQQAAPKAAPGEPSYSEKWDAELGRAAMRFVDRAGDVHPGIDDAETICAEFYKAMSEVIERMPHVQRMTPRKAAPGEPSDWQPLKTSKEGREAVRSFFREKLTRHDFDEYIMKSLAADFACVLGGYLWAAPQQEPATLSRDQIREVFMAHGFTVKEGQTDLKQYVYDAAYALLGTKPAPLSDDVSQKTWALLDELEKLRGANRGEEDWDTLNKRDSELRAALAAQEDA